MRIIKKLISIVGTLFLVPICVLSVASFLGAWFDNCELLSHLRPVLCLIALLPAVLLLMVRNWPAAIVAIINFLLNAIPLLQLYMPTGNANISPAAPHLKILQMNVWGGKNHDYKQAMATIRNVQPDIVGLSEITGSWLQELNVGLTEFPYRVAEPNHGGICILSRLPLRDRRVEFYGTIKRPRIFARVEVQDRLVTIVFAHPVIPIGHPETRNGELAELARETSSDPNPTILAGDLNCTPWSYYFSKLKADGRLHDSEAGFGFQPSWCAFWPCTIFPIDHCLMTATIVTVSRRLGPRIGSDHLPVITELVLIDKEK